MKASAARQGSRYFFAQTRNKGRDVVSLEKRGISVDFEKL